LSLVAVQLFGYSGTEVARHLEKIISFPLLMFQDIPWQKLAHWKERHIVGRILQLGISRHLSLERPSSSFLKTLNFGSRTTFHKLNQLSRVSKSAI
jgi:hypothetical protein